MKRLILTRHFHFGIGESGNVVHDLDISRDFSWEVGRDSE